MYENTGRNGIRLSPMNPMNLLLCKSMDWFLYDNGLRLERVNIYSLIGRNKRR